MSRVNGKLQVVQQIYLGTAEKIMEMALAKKKSDINIEEIKEFGGLWVANQIEKRIGLVKLIDTLLPSRSRGASPSLYQVAFIRDLIASFFE